MSSWKSLLLRIGEKSSDYGTSDDVKEHIETCYGVLRRELEHSPDDVSQFLIQCAEQLPHKSPLYGTVDALASGNCNKIRILMRFLTVMMCSKVIHPSSLVVVFETLLSSAATTVDEEKGNPSWQSRADFYITCILSCLPWGGAELIEQVPEEIERVMVGVEAYLSIRKHSSDTGLSFFEDDDENAREPSDKDFLEDLWGRIQVLSSNGWKLDSVPRPHLSFEAQLVAGKSHEFGPISCPDQPAMPSTMSNITYGKQKHDAEFIYPQRIRRLNIFPESKTEDVQPMDRFIVEDRKECASYMAGLPVPFRYEYLMAETIFSQLLMLPQPPFRPIYYTLVIIDLCKALPGAFPAVVAGAVRALFDKIADLDMECQTRLILWFSHHLSNFQFIWPWEEWAHVLDLPKWAPQRVFVQEVLEREVRLSYWDKVKQSIEHAPGLEELLPPKGAPNFKFSVEETSEGNELNALSSDLRNMVKARASAREMIVWIEESVFPVHGMEVTLNVVVQTLLDIGSKSFTHLITVLERYGQVIAKLCADQDKQVMLINEVDSYWRNNSQMTAIAIDRMMGYRLLSNLAIVRWVFLPANIEQFHISDRPWELFREFGISWVLPMDCYPFMVEKHKVPGKWKKAKILRNAVGKTYNRVCDLRKEISSMKKSVVSAEEAAATVKAELEASESKLSLMDGEPVMGENPGRLKRLKSRAEKAKEDAVSVRESLEAKEALLARSLDEFEALFFSLYKNFLNALTERLPEASKCVTLQGLKGIHADSMAVDHEESSAMDVDNENRIPKKSELNGGKTSNVYNVGEKEQWCLSTLGYLKAFSRQYASEIWPHMEKLDEEVLTEDVHPLIRKSVYCGLRRATDG
ncbi:hypothetical protein DVH24_013160 [Malus domestica]|uniref:MIF4G domain-containing protein n=1 Tax=Malus domestica TaxID=3750 RepID=A0A498IP68_MALDO|nr:hypothetical protein DVH24_013160 [Malus domestica]